MEKDNKPVKNKEENKETKNNIKGKSDLDNDKGLLKKGKNESESLVFELKTKLKSNDLNKKWQSPLCHLPKTRSYVTALGSLYFTTKKVTLTKSDCRHFRHRPQKTILTKFGSLSFATTPKNDLNRKWRLLFCHLSSPLPKSISTQVGSQYCATNPTKVPQQKVDVAVLKPPKVDLNSTRLTVCCHISKK